MKYEELLQLLKTAENTEEVDAHREEIGDLIPEVRIMFGFDQKSRYHQYDLWTHSLYVWDYLPGGLDDDMLYLAALLHDIGKPESQIAGKDPNDPYMHYYGHPAKGKAIIRDRIIPDLLAKGADISAEDRERLLFYCEHHDDTVSERPKHLLAFIRKGISREIFRNLLYLEIADAKAHVMLDPVVARIEVCGRLLSGQGMARYDEITEKYRQGLYGTGCE